MTNNPNLILTELGYPTSGDTGLTFLGNSGIRLGLLTHFSKTQKTARLDTRLLTNYTN